MRAEVYDLRQYGDLRPLAGELNIDELKKVGIYIDERELFYDFMAPWVRVFALYINDQFAAFASINISEIRYGRGKLNVFYIKPQYRNLKTAYRFWIFVLNQFAGCHRITATVKKDNSNIALMGQKHGWQIEGTLKNYDKGGNTYYQLSLTRAGKVENG